MTTGLERALAVLEAMERTCVAQARRHADEAVRNPAARGIHQHLEGMEMFALAALRRALSEIRAIHKQES